MTTQTTDSPIRIEQLPSVTLSGADGKSSGENEVQWGRAINGWTDHMITAGLAESTIAMRRYQMRRVADAHLARSPWRVSTADLVGWLSRQAWTPQTRKCNRATLRSFYGWGKHAGHTRRDPTTDLPKVKVAPALPRPVPEDILHDALATATGRDRLILLLAAYAGLRRSEIASLRWEHIIGDWLRVTGKGGRTRLVPVHPELQGALQRARLLNDLGTGSPWVFPGRIGGHLSSDVVGRIAKRLLGVYSTHTGRHRFLTQVHTTSGGDLLLTQELAGHADPKTTRGYVAVNQARAATVVAALH